MTNRVESPLFNEPRWWPACTVCPSVLRARRPGAVVQDAL